MQSMNIADMKKGIKVNDTKEKEEKSENVKCPLVKRRNDKTVNDCTKLTQIECKTNHMTKNVIL